MANMAGHHGEMVDGPSRAAPAQINLQWAKKFSEPLVYFVCLAFRPGKVVGPSWAGVERAALHEGALYNCAGGIRINRRTDRGCKLAAGRKNRRCQGDDCALRRLHRNVHLRRDGRSREKQE